MGQPLNAVVGIHIAPVYPHLRGAASGDSNWCSRRSGISPLAWGSRSSPFILPLWYRYIPTCVGQPSRESIYANNCQVYPHLRGAASVATQVIHRLGGISPLAWGSPRTAVQAVPTIRYIPTCVGQPVTCPICGICAQVYPHLRGAARFCDFVKEVAEGISPLAWGSLPNP